jgi:hypothetical protein
MGAVPVTAGQRITAALLNALPVTLAPLVTGSVSNSAAETVIGTFTIPANTITATGQGLQWRICGSADSNGTGPPTIGFQIRLGTAGTTADGLMLGSATYINERAGSSTGLGWDLDGWLYFTGTGAAAPYVARMTSIDQITSGAAAQHQFIVSTAGAKTADITSVLKLTVTATWSAASTANVARTLAGSLYPI